MGIAIDMGEEVSQMSKEKSVCMSKYFAVRKVVKCSSIVVRDICVIECICA